MSVMLLDVFFHLCCFIFQFDSFSFFVFFFLRVVWDSLRKYNLMPLPFTIQCSVLLYSENESKIVIRYVLWCCCSEQFFPSLYFSNIDNCEIKYRLFVVRYSSTKGNCWNLRFFSFFLCNVMLLSHLFLFIQSYLFSLLIVHTSYDRVTFLFENIFIYIFSFLMWTVNIHTSYQIPS